MCELLPCVMTDRNIKEHSNGKMQSSFKFSVQQKKIAIVCSLREQPGASERRLELRVILIGESEILEWRENIDEGGSSWQKANVDVADRGGKYRKTRW